MRRRNFANYFSISVAAVLCMLLSARSSEAEQGLRKIAENVYSYVDTRNASPRNGFGANAGIIIGKDGILVVDSLISAKKADEFLKDIRTISDKPVKYVVNTHSHLDHCFGNAEFEKRGTVIVAHQRSREDLQTNGEATMKRAKAYGLTDDDLEGTTIAVPKITFTRQDGDRPRRPDSDAHLSGAVTYGWQHFGIPSGQKGAICRRYLVCELSSQSCGRRYRGMDKDPGLYFDPRCGCDHTRAWTCIREKRYYRHEKLSYRLRQ